VTTLVVCILDHPRIFSYTSSFARRVGDPKEEIKKQRKEGEPFLFSIFTQARHEPSPFLPTLTPHCISPLQEMMELLQVTENAHNIKVPGISIDRTYRHPRGAFTTFPSPYVMNANTHHIVRLSLLSAPSARLFGLLPVCVCRRDRSCQCREGSAVLGAR
jgi:hypothetical protein